MVDFSPCKYTYLRVYDAWNDLESARQPPSKKSRLAEGEEEDEGNVPTQSSTTSHDHDEMMADATVSPTLMESIVSSNDPVHVDLMHSPSRPQDFDVTTTNEIRGPAGLCALKAGTPFSRKAFVNSLPRLQETQHRALSFNSFPADLRSQENAAAEVVPDVNAGIRRRLVQDSSLTEDARTDAQSYVSSGEPPSKKRATPASEESQ